MCKTASSISLKQRSMVISSLPKACRLIPRKSKLFNSRRHLHMCLKCDLSSAWFNIVLATSQTSSACLSHGDISHRWNQQGSGKKKRTTLSELHKTRLLKMLRRHSLTQRKKQPSMLMLVPSVLQGYCYRKVERHARNSRLLTDVETRYSQSEREDLPVLWACEHFNTYISSAPVAIVTDNQPLLGTWKKPNPPARIARWGLRLQPRNIAGLWFR